MAHGVPISDAAHQLRRSYAATWRLVLTGELMGYRRGRRWMVDEAGLRAYLAEEAARG